MAKIEKPSAFEHLHAIADVCHAIMVARGELGLEVPAENLPRIQKDIIRTCRQLGKPVATQMLESMRFSPAPTRAEVTDVANAVAEGADAVMLSAEPPLAIHEHDEQSHPPGRIGPDLNSTSATHTPKPPRQTPSDARFAASVEFCRSPRWSITSSPAVPV